MLCLLGAALLALAPSAVPPITDDAELSGALRTLRDAFLARRAPHQPAFTRLALCVLIKQPDGSWRRGGVDEEQTAYPASCCKLAYLAAALHWCRTHGKPYDALDADVRPMMTVSDNVATGRVVDGITGAPNVVEPGAADPPFGAWLGRRRFTEDYLSGLGLLGNQRLLTKTYPTNSGEMPIGYELRAKEECGANAMQPRLAASLALALVSGGIEPQANAYVRDLMAHTRWGGESPFGFGLPPGTVLLNKAGLAYDTLEDIAYIKLPNTREVVMAAFSNGFCDTEPGQPHPYELSILGVLCESILERLGLDEGCPPKIRVDTSSPGYSAADNLATWRLNVPEAGWYEVSVRYPEGPGHARNAAYTVYHADGESPYWIGQRHRGGRWVRLGDFPFERGGGRVTLSGGAAEAVKAVMWPPGERQERPVR